MNDIRLTAPGAAIEIVAPAERLVPISPTEMEDIRRRVGSYLDELVSLDPASPEYGSKRDALANIGSREIREATHNSSRYIDKPIRGATAAAIDVAFGMLEDVVRRLDPGRMGDLMRPRRLFGIIPIGSSRLQEYFDQYAGAQKTISDVLTRMSHGRDDLLHDNASIEGDRERLWNSIARIEKAIEMARELDRAAEIRAAALETTSPGKANALRTGAVHYGRQRTEALLTHLVVTVQGYQALDIIRQNNLLLIKGIESATTTTVAALRTAMGVAETLKMQGLALDRIKGLQLGAGKALERTATSLRDAVDHVTESVQDPERQIEALRQAFDAVNATIETVGRQKDRALAGVGSAASALTDQISGRSSLSLRDA